ncbi:MAG: septum formation protein Maf [Lachnospiraceae bacterium]|nr:septum formation protein Maf [Lachnospiraceae bacterium]
MIKYILASASPRRREILANAGISFDIIVSDCEEVISKTIPEEMVKELAEIKCKDVCKKISKELVSQYDDVIVIGADTMVFFDNYHMGKPKDEEDAFCMIKKIQNNTHNVITGVCITSLATGRINSFSETTTVHVREMSDDVIREYIKTGEGVDKAGSYAVQGIFSKYINRIEGDYFNVVGFPLCRFCQEIGM